MSVIMRREIKNFLKRPLFWIGVFIVVLGVFQDVRPYFGISYVSSDKEISLNTPSTIDDADITDGYVPTNEEDRRKMWEEGIQKNLVSEFEMGQEEAEAVIEEMKGMDIQEACEYLETKYHYYNALYAYEDTELHQGTPEEINSYIKSKLKSHRFSYYFSRKFADFSGLYMGFFAAVMLAALFWQDTRKNTYELLHTKPVRAGQYVIEHAEKVASLVLIGTQYIMPKRLLKFQNMIFHLMPNRSFRKMGFGKKDFISLSKSMIDLDFQKDLEKINCRVLVLCGEKDKAKYVCSHRIKTADQSC